ncbi:MAG TPA: T9SS type A sorting domain-containing protein [Candidatus Krumholzibacteria bacterium]|nr:T9SS type A sorting domain-containing protein [Candidatus Krumholzibacteria bacterium]
MSRTTPRHLHHPGTMRRLGVSLMFVGTATAAHASSPYLFWQQTLHYESYFNYATSVTTDLSGNVLVTGRRAVIAGEPPGTYAAMRGARLSKFTPDGSPLWTKAIDGTSVVHSPGLVTDPSGDIALAGYFRGEVDFGGGIDSTIANDAGFLVKYDPDGVYQWSHAFVGTGTCQATTVAVAADGSVVVGGYFDGTVDFGGGAVTSTGALDAFLARFDANGVHEWTRRFGDAQSQSIAGITVDLAGRVSALGSFRGTIDLGGGALSSAGMKDIFFAQFDGSGAHLWSRRFGGANDDGPNDLVVDTDGNLAMNATFSGTVDFGGGPLTGSRVIARYDSGGSHLWSRTWNVLVAGLACGVDGDVYLSGFPVTATTYDLSITRFAPDGTPVSNGTVTADGRSPAGIAVDSAGDIVLIGNLYTGERDEGETFDVFVAKYGLGEPVIDAVADVPDDQGRRITVTFDGSRFDRPPVVPAVVRYDIYLRDDPLPPGVQPPMAALAGRGPVPAAPPGNWIYMASVTADGSESYAPIVATLADSTLSAGAHESVYFVRAAFADPAFFYDSPPESGHSLDNLPPPPPANFAFAAGHLSWDASAEEDFDYFRVWASYKSVFDGSAVLLAQTSLTWHDVQVFVHEHYYVTTLDFSGNEGAPAHAQGVDNVAPSSPTDLVYDTGVLSWQAPPEGDVDHYVVYGSAFDVFDQHTTIAQTAEPTMDVSASAWLYYFVTAVDLSGNESLPAQTYGIDIVPPSSPSGLTCVDAILRWRAPPEEDVAFYTVYGSAFADFAQNKTTTGKTTGLSYDMSDDPFAYYFVTATDNANNESVAAMVRRTPYTLSVKAFPNPFNPATTVRYQLPRRGHVAVRVHDARGSLVVTLVDDVRDAGTYETTWSGEGALGARVSSGIYFLTLDLDGDTKTQKLVLIK